MLPAQQHGIVHRHSNTNKSVACYQVLFSSIAALLGAPGQANYSAANAALDSMAGGWQTTGTPVKAVQWGAWAGSGMAAKARPAFCSKLS